MSRADLVGRPATEQRQAELDLRAQQLEDAPRARLLYPLLLPFADRHVTATCDLSVGSSARILGGLGSLIGEDTAARGHFEQALEQNAAWDIPTWLAHTEHDYAAALLRRAGPGDHALAGELLDRARETAERLGMTVLAERAAAARERADGLPVA